MNNVRLTQYSHGAGCGCKISPGLLHEILSDAIAYPDNKHLLVGNHSKDDAAVYDIGNGQCLISTTDFFMPIVDDPFQFGQIASANAISDVYAMGGKPILAIAILGWPIQTLPASVAKEVISGARDICGKAGIKLAGGHSIDAPEPIFGLAVNGLVHRSAIKQNNTARIGDYLFLTKKIGVGLLATAEKKGVLLKEDFDVAANQMVRLNSFGNLIAHHASVHAMTDVTGFGLMGHLLEMVDGAQVSATLQFEHIPLLSKNVHHYIKEGCIPGGTRRNYDSYGAHMTIDNTLDWASTMAILCDPQTSGGLLISVGGDGLTSLKNALHSAGLDEFIHPIGRITEEPKGRVRVQ